MHETFIPKFIKHDWVLNLKSLIDEWIYEVHGLEESILLRCQFSSNWATDEMQSQSKPQQVFKKNRNCQNSKIYVNMHRIQNSQNNSENKRSKSGGLRYPILRLTIK